MLAFPVLGRTWHTKQVLTELPLPQYLLTQISTQGDDNLIEQLAIFDQLRMLVGLH